MENQWRIERKGFQPFPMAGGKDGGLVHLDALEAPSRSSNRAPGVELERDSPDVLLDSVKQIPRLRRCEDPDAPLSSG